MLKAILRTTLFASAAYGIYSVAKKLYPSQVDSALNTAKSFGTDALNSAKSFGTDAVKSIGEQGKQMSGSTKDSSRRAV